ncbi:hypothetical protein [Streptosporangium sp. NPDC087985]|uniref:hypothetical protein n=1 Tax=Streptosporangium sp. NPDC087985 TaxID=3366196 RepID=UPI0037F99279
MRGQESGSEHEREAEGSATPATPPPSFGQPSPHVPRTALTGDDQPYDPSAWPEPSPGTAQPWTVPGDGDVPYDWFADPDDGLPTPPGPSASPWAVPPLPTGAAASSGAAGPSGTSIVPGAPPWQPPPAFTAATADTQPGWPSSAPDAHGAPQRPPATGEPAWPGLEGTTVPHGDVAVWPPSAAFPGNPDENTVKVHTAKPAVPGHEEPPGSTPPPGPGSPPSVPASAAQSPASPPELMPQVSPSSSEPLIGVAVPSPAPATQLPEPVQDPDSGRPGLSPPAEDQTTPLSGSPMTAPLFPLVPAPPAQQPAQQPAPSAGTVELRGPFTPPSAVVPEVAVSSPAPPPRGKAGTLLVAAVVVVVVGGIGTGAFFAYQSFNAKKEASAAVPIPIPEVIDPTEDPEPSAPEPANTAVIDSEKTDPGNLTLARTFTKKVTIAGETFVRVKTDVTQQCQTAAAGKFAGALRSKDCRRVLRATYVDSKRKYAVTTGIAVLPTRESAIEVDKAKDLNSNLWFRGLPGTPGTGAERVHIAGGYAAGLVWGRYIVFSYATFSDGHTPTAREKGLGKVSGAFRDQTAQVVERRVRS